jgi:hypothetical protein
MILICPAELGAARVRDSEPAELMFDKTLETLNAPALVVLVSTFDPVTLRVPLRAESTSVVERSIAVEISSPETGWATATRNLDFASFDKAI